MVSEIPRYYPSDEAARSYSGVEAMSPETLRNELATNEEVTLSTDAEILRLEDEIRVLKERKHRLALRRGALQTELSTRTTSGE